MKENKLGSETSLYLLQHAKNPIHWQPWSDEVLGDAKSEGKLVIVSIGYSACHWCHVMEKESFENEDVARFMNANFVNIKVDREERPDVDQLYMSALHLMGVQGGWPLNCILLPDGRPIYGGTYFTQHKWLKVLKSLVETCKNEPKRVEEFAQEMQDNLEDKHYERVNHHESVNEERLNDWVMSLKASFDSVYGGYEYVPKFPLPNHLDFILRHGYKEHDIVLKDHIRTTLFCMANGGIYDHVEGGFARYSTDASWKVPHFEKMLYDNAQLMSVYSNAARNSAEASEYRFYRSIVEETFGYLLENLRTLSGSYLCAQDADSGGSEGGYYCWTELELKELLKTDYSWFKDLYNIRPETCWENDLFILQKTASIYDFARKQNWTEDETYANINRIRSILSARREKRIKPSIDTKSLTSWNALLIDGLCQAYLAFNHSQMLNEANSIADWIRRKMTGKDGLIARNFAKNKANINGFLDDYALTIQAFIKLYQINGMLSHLEYAKDLCETVISKFYSEKQKLFYFTQTDSRLIARKIDIDDDVIPSSNSVMAHNLNTLGIYYRLEDWLDKSKLMLATVQGFINKYPSSYVNWIALYERLLSGSKEISVLLSAPPEHAVLSKLIQNSHVISYHKELPMSQGQKENGIYLCQNKSCLPKMSSIHELLEALDS